MKHENLLSSFMINNRFGEFSLYQLYDLHSSPDGRLLYGDALFKKGDGSIF